MDKTGRDRQWNLWYLLSAVLGVLFLRLVFMQWQLGEPLPYSEFLQELKSDNVKEVAIFDNEIQGVLSHPRTNGRTAFVTTRVDKQLAEELALHNVKFSGVIRSTLLRDILGWIIPAVLFFGIWMFVIRRMMEKGGLGSGFMSIGKSHAKVYVEQNTRVTFDDVAGVDEAKEELQEVIGFLRDPASYGRLGARVPRGILLVGPPGTGKTLLARAVAGEASVPFFSINGSEFVEMFVGVGAARVRDMFEQARQKSPAIIFIDEIDALGRARGAYGLGGHDEKEQTLNQLLAELDGFDTASGLVLLAATNRPEILDPALLRAGRFDRQILVDRPDKKGRIQILDVHLRKVKLAGGVDREQIAALTPGFSGADLANLVNEAALLATRHARAAVALEDFTAAIERIVAGLEKKNRLINPLEREVVAYHEMGHALVALALPGSDSVHKVSIIPRGIGSLGYTIQRPIEDRFLMTQQELENKMAVLLGGRAAEQLIFERATTGAADDLVKVTEIARSMVTRYGMSRALGQLSYEGNRNVFLPAPAAEYQSEIRNYSETTAREIDCAVREIVDAAFLRASAILRENRTGLEAGAKKLLDKETLNEDEVKAFAPHPALPAAP
ncbi:ATP-dependent zinc metalloprotease FtsH [Herminiimonas sp. CN]|uniref:ATP-dependent zinc metalloprotease FtsH n=1 Tax=Herminiimonas sp. CN TaxID=1349818 RepID=UPI000A66F05C|nr:ATP-dependent zinc metalloprotease FtsH [Herminiimonas sp. CN]